MWPGQENYEVELQPCKCSVQNKIGVIWKVLLCSLNDAFIDFCQLRGLGDTAV